MSTPNDFHSNKGIQKIEGKAFAQCVNLAEITIPDGVTELGSEAFSGCRLLTDVQIPDSVTGISESAFEKCASLAEVRWSQRLHTIEKRAFYGCELLGGILALPLTVKTIGVNAFVGCNYTEINLPEGLETIGTGALACGSYSELHIPASVKEMGFCTGYFTGDLYIHGVATKLKANDYHGMPIVIHAPANSYAAKCAESGVFDEFHVIED